MDGVGQRASHNLIHDCPRFGLVWGGNDHVFEFNEIRHCNLETADCGAIYSWQVDWSKRGTEIRYNYLHDIVGFGQEGGKWVSPHMNWGVYLDDGTCGVHVYGNVIARTILGGVHYHGGRDNVVENNILIDGRDSQVQYSGYVKGGHPVPMMTDTWNKFSGTAAYLKYPGYEELTKSLEDAWQMAGNKFLRNIVCYSEPTARLYAHGNLPFDKTDSDYNLVWHDGAPILTGVTRLKSVTGPNLVANPGFEESEDGQLPTGWQWQVKPNDSEAKLDPEVHLAGKQSLRLDGRGLQWPDAVCELRERRDAPQTRPNLSTHCERPRREADHLRGHAAGLRPGQVLLGQAHWGHRRPGMEAGPVHLPLPRRGRFGLARGHGEHPHPH
jgi:hypothetical protein